jgi:hypothetical protein
LNGGLRENEREPFPKTISMSQAGTLLSDLESSPGSGSDGDLVNQILADMNSAPTMANPPPQQPMNLPPPAGNRMAMQQAPQMQQNFPQASDPAVPTAHMIGREHPTPADFNAMMMGSAYTPQEQQVYRQPQPVEAPTKNWQAQWADEFKLPILVAIVTLLVTLPAVNLLVSHYAPKLLRPGGDLNVYGLVVRSLLAGGLFWFLQRVVAPLVSL